MTQIQCEYDLGRIALQAGRKREAYDKMCFVAEYGGTLAIRPQAANMATQIWETRKS